jgi:hypothetical protein
MFELYNEPARRALFFARYEASVLGSRTIEAEHLLVGILRVGDPLVVHLAGGGQAVEAIRKLVDQRVSRATPFATSIEIPFTKNAKRALEYTAEESRRLLHEHIGLEHLLLGLLRLDEGLAAEILKERRLVLASVRDALVLHVSANSPPPPEVARMLEATAPGGAACARPSGPVYVMAAIDGNYPGRRRTADDPGVGNFGSFSTVSFGERDDRPPDGRTHSIGPIWMSGTALAQFAMVVEGFLGSPVMVEDSALLGKFDIELQGTYDNADALIAALRDQLGLALTRRI